MSRKDSKGMFAAVLGQLDQENKEEQAQAKSSSPHLLKVAAGVRQMQERSELAEKLLKTGEQIIEIEPDQVVASSIHDRFDEGYNAEAIAEIVQSMRDRGQIVPGLVRPLANQPGRYQIVYGRRRLAAARQLGVKFRAAVRELSDQEAVIFQGEENTAREDLSFIEKCLFAFAQEEAGFGREVICASLSTGKSHVSEMIKIGSSIDRDILYAIGKAPGIGRGRWEEFAARWSLPGAAAKIRMLAGQAGFRETSSDERFLSLLAALPQQETATAAPSSSAQPQRAKAIARKWAARDRSVQVAFKGTDRKATLSVESSDGTRFAEFIADQLDVLYDAFKATESDKN